MLKLMTCKRIVQGGLYDAVVGTEGKIMVSPQGGGPVIASFATEAEFLKEFIETAPDLELRKATVTADFLPGLEMPCYANCLKWNGFSMPRFDTATAVKLVEAFTLAPANGTPPSLRWSNDGVLEEYDWSDEKYIPCDSSTELIDGQPVRLYSIGDGWAWDAVEFDIPAAQ